MTNTEQQQLIEASPLFRNVQPHETAAIGARLQAVSYEQGTRIIERGVWHGQLHIIASGQVNVLLQEGEPRASLVVARLGPGDCFGEMSLITGELPTATIRTEQDTRLWSLTQADFLALMASCPTLLKNINTILSRRLAQTNQQILEEYTAERIWLAFLDMQPAATGLLERSLVFFIADALATCSQKRVLLLELCTEEQAVGLHFATHANQLRPSLLACRDEPSLLQAHQASTLGADGWHYAALAVLGQETALDASLSACLANLRELRELAARYDYLLLATNSATPSSLVQAVAEQSERAMVLVSANGGTDVAQHATPLAAMVAPTERSVFVTNTLGSPTIGLQDVYAAQLGGNVTRLLPIDTPLLERCWQQQETPARLSPQAELSKAISFVARHIAHQTVGIAFGGGGARGFAHLGVLERLLDYGVPVDYIAACSSGIITPGMYLIGKSFAESEEIFLQVQRQIVWNFPRTSIFSSKGLKRMLREVCGTRRFEDLTTPFAMVAIDLSTRSGVVLDRGPIWQAGLASVALPGIFPPVLIGEHILMDAGMHDPVPIRLIRKMGADILLASELGGQEPPSLISATPWLEAAEHQQQERDQELGKRSRSPHIIDLLLRTYDLAMATIGMHSIREADIVIRPKLHRVSLRQFSEGRKFVAAGREAVEQALPALKKRLPWL